MIPSIERILTIPFSYKNLPMIPPIERILTVPFSYKNLVLIFSPVLIDTKEKKEKTLEVLSILNRKKETCNLTTPELDYQKLLKHLVDTSLVE
jgi:hypothetical protein